MVGKLYLAATHIGNPGDLSSRCVKILSRVDFIAAEHKGVTERQLLELKISKPVVSCYGRGIEESGKMIVSRILNGESCALVTDAGTPAISDPGEYVVRLCSKNGINIISIPGPSAVIAALAASGLPTGRFTFEGFLSKARISRYEHLNELKNEKRTMVFYEVSRKLKSTIEDMLACWGDRQIVIMRDISKPTEERLAMTLSEGAEYFSKNPAKGEFVLVIEGASQNAD